MNEKEIREIDSLRKKLGIDGGNSSAEKEVI